MKKGTTMNNKSIFENDEGRLKPLDLSRERKDGEFAKVIEGFDKTLEEYNIFNEKNAETILANLESSNIFQDDTKNLKPLNLSEERKKQEFAKTIEGLEDLLAQNQEENNQYVKKEIFDDASDILKPLDLSNERKDKEFAKVIEGFDKTLEDYNTFNEGNAEEILAKLDTRRKVIHIDDIDDENDSSEVPAKIENSENRIIKFFNEYKYYAVAASIVLFLSLLIIPPGSNEYHSDIIISGTSGHGLAGEGILWDELISDNRLFHVELETEKLSFTIAVSKEENFIAITDTNQALLDGNVVNYWFELHNSDKTSLVKKLEIKLFCEKSQNQSKENITVDIEKNDLFSEFYEKFARTMNAGK